MAFSNTTGSYGSIARSLHWLMALLILSNFGLGLWAEDLPRGSDAEVAWVAQIYSAHKTIGVAAFFLALIRVLWALSQIKPHALHPDRRLETFAAEAVHWSLYAAILLVPASGWVHHAATTGFAPILWPFGQSLPFVPKSEMLALTFKSIHGAAVKLLFLSLALHIAGALKHLVIDRDGTVARMLTGREIMPESVSHSALYPALAALLAWGAILGVGVALSPQPANVVPPAMTNAENGNWAVTDGTLSFTVRQMGQDVTGNFAGWQATIIYDEGTKTGTTNVTIPLSGMTLGAVTTQAAGPEFFDVGAHPTAIFNAGIDDQDGQLVAAGTLSLKGQDVPMTLPFTLAIDGDTATMSGQITLDRRDFGMGPSYPDESTVGFGVVVDVELRASRQ